MPERAFVNDVKADLFDAETVYVALDNHKEGDFAPYLFVSRDLGHSWSSLRGNLPERTLVWRVVQDHVAAGLLFVATEFGVLFSVDGGGRWTELGGIPTISIRDLAIQRREGDLVAASFGRSFYVLDDYTALREVSDQQLAADATLFAPRDARWYVPRPVLSFDADRGSQGASHFVAPNPPFGAVFTYYLAEDLQSAAERRKKGEKERADDQPSPGFPGLGSARSRAARARAANPADRARPRGARRPAFGRAEKAGLPSRRLGPAPPDAERGAARGAAAADVGVAAARLDGGSRRIHRDPGAAGRGRDRGFVGAPTIPRWCRSAAELSRDRSPRRSRRSGGPTSRRCARTRRWR